ncbi:MAG: glycoside hydrolase/phage tail family protein [Devosia sp.]|nr:glycoside hydrolase/phage tail family protein [Devosia sp.]
MATLALSLAGQVVGGALGGPIGATIGRALGALAGSAVDSMLFAERPEPMAGADIRLQGSTEGGPVPRLYGWGRLTGNIIWATELEELNVESAGAKGTTQSGETGIAASFAVALCEGEVQRLGRIWADGQPLETSALAIRFYRGTESQIPDSLIEAKQGTGQTPGYRGLCYLVFERLPLGQFGNRIPNISVELCRVVGELEPAVRAVTVIPGATEFGYDPAPRVRIVSPGATAGENTHLSAELSNWTLSIDELTALCPNLGHVALVVSWFGDDLRCGECTIKPRVEAAVRQIDGTSWSVAGLSRASAQVVSYHDGGPAYGGTPSDAAVLAAIADLKARGLKVTLYPLIMMDVPAGNALPDPHTGAAGQPAYPWRGRITCDPAPGVAGTPDQTSAAAAQIGAFIGTGSGWDYRRMALHYAQLAVIAGGVDAFIIGSEMRGLSTVRGPGNSFPFVEALVTLVADARAIVGGATKLAYAADWSEYHGYQPPDAPGDKLFHLDPLWASPHIDAIGIDNYMPLSDWRDGDAHADAAAWDAPYDPAYLRANIAGGEGFDWYYASDADRIDGIRSPIADSAHGEPWAWRCKDLGGWWGNAHHDRIGGERSATPTAWVPQSKPVWFTELGCGAVDKGANQPNIFGDPKSAESGRPYFSSGASDALQQRQFLRAHLDHWSRPEANPLSGSYGGSMLDMERIYLWTWDARPYPAFPGDAATWRDAANHATGHWLTGRLGTASSDQLLRAIAADYGVTLADVAAAAPLIHGLRVEGVVSCREAMAPVLAAAGLSLRDTPGGLTIGRTKTRLGIAIGKGETVAADGPLTIRRRPDPSEEVGQVALSYPDRERAYLTGTVTAMRLSGGAAAGENTNLVLDLAEARRAAERILLDHAVRRDTLELALPPSFAGLEAGDAIGVEGQGGGPFEVTEIRDGEVRRITARAIPPVITAAIVSGRPPATAPASVTRAIPVVAAAHLPPDPANPGQTRLMLAASASPWPGEVTVTDEATGSTIARLTKNCALGELAEPLGAGQMFTWDDVATLTLRLFSGHLSSKDDAMVLAGGNRLAIETDSGAWEIAGFANAELLSPGLYRLTRLLRGQMGTGHALGPAASGRRVVVLDDRPLLLPVPPQWLGEARSLRAYAGRADPAGTVFPADLDLAPMLPLAPVHLRAKRGAGDDIAITWFRRSRADTDSWAVSDAPLDILPEAYTVTIMDGATPVRTIDASAPVAAYAGALQATDFGIPPANLVFTIAQESQIFGGGHAAEGRFDV